MPRPRALRVSLAAATTFALAGVFAGELRGLWEQAWEWERGAARRPAAALVPWRDVQAPLPKAYCEADVEGVGVVDVESDYLPRVIQCENGGADLEALKAQAIAARSVLYYSMATQGSICDGQACQVYSCGATPKPIHVQAVRETAGQYLSFDGLVTYGFYVDGDRSPSPRTCKGSPRGNNERFVTYNDGLTDAAVQQTALGFVGPPGYGQNRGCMAQWGARCLEASHGRDHREILQFYYGADIEVLTAPGACEDCRASECAELSTRGVKQASLQGARAGPSSPNGSVRSGLPG